MVVVVVGELGVVGRQDQPRCPDTSQVEVKLSLGANLPTRSQSLAQMKLYFTPPPQHQHHPPPRFHPSQAATISSSTVGRELFWLSLGGWRARGVW